VDLLRRYVPIIEWLPRYERETQRPPTVTHEVDKILGRRARTFATWAADHRGAWS